MPLWSNGISKSFIGVYFFTLEKIIKIIFFNLVRHPHDHSSRGEYKSNTDVLGWLYADFNIYLSILFTLQQIRKPTVNDP